MLIIISLLLISVSSLELRHVQDQNALCLDGTRGSYYYRAGTGSGIDKYFLFFQGGAWIEGESQEQILYSAYERSSTHLGSSKALPLINNVGGIFSELKTNNPMFYNWNMILVNYCDGTGLQGYAAAPIQVLDKLLYFRGELIVNSILSEFNSQLIVANTVIVSGCSAGGLAVFSWVQHIRNILPKSVSVLGVPDSGIFQDMPAIDGSKKFRQSFEQMRQIVNIETNPPNTECIEANKGDTWKCFHAQYMMKYITVPLFLVQSLYDSACIEGLLLINCAKDLTLTKCSSKETQYIEIHHSNIQIIIDGRLESDRQSGTFAPGCLEHCFLHTDKFNSNRWRVPNQSGPTISEALSAWVLDYHSGNPDNHNHSDHSLWPTNQGCSNINKSFNE